MADSDQLQQELLRALYNEHKEDPFGGSTTQDIIDDAVGSFDDEVDSSEIDYALRVLDEDRKVEHNPDSEYRGGIEMRPGGVKSLQEEAGGTYLASDERFEILQTLQQLDQDDPGGFHSPEAVLESPSDLDQETADQNIWYMREKGWIEASVTNRDPPWGSVRIKKAGRRVLERR